LGGKAFEVTVTIEMGHEHGTCVRGKKGTERRIPFFGFVTAFFFFFFFSFPAVLGLDPVFVRVDLGFDSGSGLEFAVESEFRLLAVVVRFLWTAIAKDWLDDMTRVCSLCAFEKIPGCESTRLNVNDSMAEVGTIHKRRQGRYDTFSTTSALLKPWDNISYFSQSW
jgi:hypothetical protein